MVRGWVVASVLACGVGSASASPHLDIRGDACVLDGLGSKIDQLAETDAAVRIDQRAVGDAFEARVQLDDRTRVVTASTCDELRDSLALVIAMAIPDDPIASPPAPVSVSVPEPVVTGGPKLEVIAHAPVRASARTTDMILAGAVTSQSATSQLLAGVRWRDGARSVEAELQLDAPSQQQVNILRSEVSIAPCVHAGAFAGCGVVSAGAIRGSGAGLVLSSAAYAPVVSTGLRLTWEHAVFARVAVRLHAQADAVLTTTTFDVDHMPVWRSSRLDGSLGIGVLARFP